MPADLSALLDTLLVIAGLILVGTGLVMFIYSKTSSQASSVEAFGIKLNVTHPSLILVLAGVGLMLAPRLLPGLPGKDKPEPTVMAQPGLQPPAPSLEASPERAAAPTPQPAPSPPIPVAAAPAAAVPTKPATRPQVQPSRAETPRVAAAPTRKPVAAVAADRPAIAPKPTVIAVPVAPAASPPAAARPARPTLAYAALGLPSHHSFWSGETRASYTRRVQTGLQQAGRDVLHMDARGLDLNQAEFDAWWNESRQHPRSRELCTSPHAPRALLSTRVETPMAISTVESAYWPELKLRLFDCANQRLYQQQKTLSPQNDDAWPFANEFNGEVERFLRTYRGDLTN
jgi:hypothetical protein